MRKNRFAFALFAVLFLLASIVFPQQNQTHPSHEFQGIWQGTLKIGATQLRVVFHIQKDKSGALSATMDSPDQAAKDIAVDKVETRGDSLFLVVNAVMGSYAGVFEKNKIKGRWSQSGMTLALDLHRVEKVAKIKRPQEPKKPYPYPEKEVVVENKKAGVKLAGTLTLPKQGAPFAAVILISGSGPQDRNETVFGHRPFLVLADDLTRKGIAVLRLDDRGVGGSNGDFSKATTKDFASDVLADVEFLKSLSDIRKDQIGLVGHSEGALIAPMVASQSRDVAFIILMAGPGLPGEEILLLQSELINRGSGMPEDKVRENSDMQKMMFALIKNEKDDSVLKQKLGELVARSISAATRKKITASDPAVQMQAKNLLSPWFRFFLMYDPVPALEKVSCPVLAINGEKDVQVPPKQNLAAIEKALQKGNNKDFLIKELPGLNHLFQKAKTGLPTEYAKIEETISPTALQIMSDWILAHSKGK